MILPATRRRALGCSVYAHKGTGGGGRQAALTDARTHARTQQSAAQRSAAPTGKTHTAHRRTPAGRAPSSSSKLQRNGRATTGPGLGLVSSAAVAAPGGGALGPSAAAAAAGVRIRSRLATRQPLLADLPKDPVLRPPNRSLGPL